MFEGVVEGNNRRVQMVAAGWSMRRPGVDEATDGQDRDFLEFV